jgi:hypothetical protein
MTLEINKKAILEEFELNPFKIYAKYKVNKDMEAMRKGFDSSKNIKPEMVKDSPKVVSIEPEHTGTLENTMSNIHNHNAALEDAMKMLNH